MPSHYHKSTELHKGRFKILCLHGIGTNSDIFEAQTAALRYHLGPDSVYEFDFLDGSHQWPAHPAIAAIYGAEQVYLSYHDGSASGALETLDDLAAYILEDGPFDAVMGFSMGSSLAASLLLRPVSLSNDRPDWAAARSMVRSAVFLCGIRPVNTMALMNGEMVRVETGDIGPDGKWAKIEIPTVHVWSYNDFEIPNESQALVDMCVKDKRVEVLHTAGHAVPFESYEIEAAAAAMRGLFEKLHREH